MAALPHVNEPSTRFAMTQSALPITQLASVIRSKNAGPLCFTVDLFFRDAAAYQLAAQSEALQCHSVADCYGLLVSQVMRFELPDILAIKLSMPRTVCAGNPGDGDLYGAQQHAPLLSLMV
jgi:hypothetical protein